MIPESMIPIMDILPPNTARGCVKSVGVIFGNDPISVAKHFDEASR